MTATRPGRGKMDDSRRHGCRCRSQCGRPGAPLVPVRLADAGTGALHPQRTVRDAVQDDARREDLYVPPTYASQGLVYVCDRLRTYREAGGEAVILPAVVGRMLARGLTQRSPEIQTIVSLDTLRGRIRLASRPGRLAGAGARRNSGRLPSDACGRRRTVGAGRNAGLRGGWTRLAGVGRGILEGGGDGIVAVGGREVPRHRRARPDAWPFETAIQCGASLAAYRQSAIEAARRAFPGRSSPPAEASIAAKKPSGPASMPT